MEKYDAARSVNNSKMLKMPGRHRRQDTHHLHCPAPSARTQWALSLATLDQWLKDQGLDPLLQKRLISALNNWANAAESQAPSNTAYEMEQAHIGWDRMMDGWISQKWRDHQERIWKSIKSRKSSL